jgi:5-methylcytosine-specific restriction endonuclease McrA
VYPGPRPRWWRRRRKAERVRTKLPPDRRLLLAMGAAPPKRGKEWKLARAQCIARQNGRCGACNGPLPKPQVDHIIPELLLFQHGITNPHEQVNLIAIHPRCHGRKKTIEDLLFRGDKIGFLAGLRRLNWPMERVEEAMRSYQL